VNNIIFCRNVTVLKSDTFKFVIYKSLKTNIMKIIMLGMAAFLFSINIQAQKKNVKTEVNITILKILMEIKVIQTKEVEEVQTIQLKMLNSKFKQGYKVQYR
jgi:hypothetical protein